MLSERFWQPAVFRGTPVLWFAAPLALAIGLFSAVLHGDDARPVRRVWDFDSPESRPPANQELPPGFQSAAGAWAVVADGGNHVLAQTARSNDAVFNLVLIEGTRFTDLELTVKLRAQGGKVDQGGGLVWRAKDSRNYYVARYNPLEDNFRAYKVVDGQRKQLETAKVPSGGPDWHSLRITMRGSRIHCLLDDKVRLDAEDETFPAGGKIGLWCKSDANTWFDDLAVVGTVPPAAAAPPVRTGEFVTMQQFESMAQLTAVLVENQATGSRRRR